MRFSDCISSVLLDKVFRTNSKEERRRVQAGCNGWRKVPGSKRLTIDAGKQMETFGHVRRRNSDDDGERTPRAELPGKRRFILFTRQTLSSRLTGVSVN